MQITDRNQAIKAIKEDPYNYQELSDDLKNDKDLNLTDAEARKQADALFPKKGSSEFSNLFTKTDVFTNKKVTFYSKTINNFYFFLGKPREKP